MLMEEVFVECAQVLIEELRMVVRLVIFIFMAIKLRLEKEKGSLSFAPSPIKLSVLATDKRMHVGAAR